jgi:type III pantothenate kinase
MNADVVVDVGNTRIKWGRCSVAGVLATCSLPTDDHAAWNTTAAAWELPPRAHWVIAGVHPAHRDAFARWAESRGDRLTVLTNAERLPLRVQVPEPGKVGIDRLLDAVAVNSRRPTGQAAVVVDAGSAVTVDLVSAEGAFVGGVILPGLRLMGRALHEHTALLPLVDPPATLPPVPATATIPAIQAGMIFAVVGGVRFLLEHYQRHGLPRGGSMTTTTLQVFLTGGDAPFLAPHVPGAVVWSEMTLEGIRLSARALA